ncbi:MAG: DMT family transporter, partial [Candidatus Aenigmarchaeota archaeon]|nr:DMT family transporter [Candidatus Aenigmarchaeota archaeon]
TIIVYTWPIFATIFSTIILKEKIIKRNIYLLMLAFTGTVFIFFNQKISFGNLEFLGLMFMFATAILHAFVIVIFKGQSDKNSKYETIFYQNIIGFLMFLPFIFINKPLPNLLQTGMGIAYGTFIGLVAYIFFFSALKKIKASTASHLTYVEVVSAIIFGMIIFKESLTWNVIVGGLLIITSTYLLKR